MRLSSSILAVALLSGCASSGSGDGSGNRRMDPSRIHDVVPKYEPQTRAGNPPKYTINGVNYRLLKTHIGYKERGIASWYGTKFHGRSTSNGEKYDMYAMTAAHKTLPIPCYVRVTRQDNGKSIIVRVNDRGPFVTGRIIDLSYAAAIKIGMTQAGTAKVTVEAINVGSAKSKTLPKPAATPPAYTSVYDSPASTASAWSFDQTESGASAAPPTPVAARQSTAAPSVATKRRAPDPNQLAAGYYVQHSAFSSYDNGLKVMGTLATRGFNPRMLQVNSANSPYRIWFGPYQNREQTAAFQARLEERGLDSGFVVRNK